MRPSHENIKRDQDTRDQRLYKDITGLLADLVDETSTKGDLKIGARVLRLAKAMNVYDSSMSSFEEVLKGRNKHKTDFVEALGD